MGIQIYDNQPIVFNQPVDTCIDASDYIQIIDQTDTTQFQTEVTPCLGAPQIITESSFDVFPSVAWVLDGFDQTKFGNVSHSVGAWGLLDQNDVFILGNVYQVSIFCSEFFGVMGVYNGSVFLGNIETTGESIFTFVATQYAIKLWITNGYTSCVVESITAYQINEDTLIAIRNNTTDAIVTTFTLASNPTRFVFKKNTMTVSIPWDELAIADGCYYISVDDGCNNVCGQLGLFNEELFQTGANSGTFTNTGFSATGTFTSGGIGSDTNSIDTNVPVSGQIIITNDITDFCAGIEYDISIDIVTLTNNGTLVVSIGNVSSVTFTTTGTKTFSLTPSVAGKFVITHSSDGIFATVFNAINLSVALADANDYSFGYDSIPFKLGTFPCSLLLNISNNNDAFNFVFVDSFFAPRIRLDATLKNSQYKTERKIRETANGIKQVYYGNQRKDKMLATEGVPEYVFDFVALFPIADHLFIDGIEYFVEDNEINTTYPNGLQDYGQILLLLSVKEQARENRNAGNPINPISATEGFIVHPVFRTEILTEPSTTDTVLAF